ncbi:MAG: type II secretion system minor pseudopilin GspK [Comamonas sp.]
MMLQRNPFPTKHQRGAALLAAMLTVTLVASLAAAALWQQWRDVEIETAERNRVQASWLLLGALDWSRVVIQEDSRANRKSPVDHLGEPWAVPLQEARLSTFLNAKNNVSNVDDDQADVQAAFLSGEIIDLQSRLNLRSLMIDPDKPLDADRLKPFVRLFERLGLPSSQVLEMANALRNAAGTSAGKSAASNTPLMPRTLRQLGWLGLDPRLIARMEPFLVLLPEVTKINLNTASPEVIWAVEENLDWSAANQLVQLRSSNPFKSTSDAAKALGRSNLFASGFGTTTEYFEARGRLRMGDNMLSQRSILQRKDMTVTTLWQERGDWGLPVTNPIP